MAGAVFFKALHEFADKAEGKDAAIAPDFDCPSNPFHIFGVALANELEARAKGRSKGFQK
eukprot:scaffold2324_cov57-Attheya_sp.AAC.3